MTTMWKRVIPCVLMAVFAVAAPAAAQIAPDDPVAAGYRLLYDGDKTAASRHFEGQLKAHPDDLPLRFGLLVTLNERGRAEPTVLPDLERGLDGIIALAEGRYNRSKQDAEALFYLAQAHMLRAEYRVNHNKGLWGAARDGANAKGYIETYVKQHPAHNDAYLVLGTYNYYVELAPTLFKTLRFLLFLPSGNRTEGLKQLERAASQGRFFAPRAQTLLMAIYSSFEGRVPDAVAVGDRLRRQYPNNDDFDFETADLYMSPAVEDDERAAAAYQEILDRRRVDSSLDGSTSRYRALLGLANVRLDQWRVEDAITTLAPPIDAGVTNPDWVMPQFLLRRGSDRAALNDPKAADDARRVLADPKMAKWHQAATDQITSITTRAASGEAALSASMVPANRLVSEGKYDEAKRAYDAIAAKNPTWPNVKWRLAYLEFTRGNAEAALPALNVLAASKTMPENIRANALLYAARAHDLAGRREDARKMYQKVIDDFEKQRAAGLAKMGLLTPYKRPVRT